MVLQQNISQPWRDTPQTNIEIHKKIECPWPHCSSLNKEQNVPERNVLTKHAPTFS